MLGVLTNTYQRRCFGVASLAVNWRAAFSAASAQICCCWHYVWESSVARFVSDACHVNV